MGLLDGETLTLPSGLATLAGFGTGMQGEYNVEQDRIDAAMMSARNNFEETAKLNPLSAEEQLDFAPAPPTTAITPWRPGVDSTTTPERGWHESPDAYEPLPNLSTQEAHPLLTDSRFHQAMRQDPKAAVKLYQSITGRDLKSDMAIKAASDKTQADEAKSTVHRLIGEGLDFDPITGAPQVVRPKKGALSLPGAPTPMETQPVSSIEAAQLHRSFKSVTGLDMPEGMPVPKGLSSQEAMSFRQKVSEYKKGDASKDSDEIKTQRAYTKVWQAGWNSQQTAAAIASNPAAEKANPPGIVASTIAKLINTMPNIGAAINHRFISPAIGTPEIYPDQVSGSQIGEALPFDRMLNRFKSGGTIYDTSLD